MSDAIVYTVGSIGASHIVPTVGKLTSALLTCTTFAKKQQQQQLCSLRATNLASWLLEFNKYDFFFIWINLIKITTTSNQSTILLIILLPLVQIQSVGTTSTWYSRDTVLRRFVSAGNRNVLGACAVTRRQTEYRSDRVRTDGLLALQRAGDACCSGDYGIAFWRRQLGS